MTTHNYKVLKNYPVQFTVKNPRCWWQTINTAYGEDATVDVELVPFETLEHTFTNPLVTFNRQTLLDGTILEEQTKILAESGKEWTYADGNTDITVIGTLTEDNGVYSGGYTSANHLLLPIEFAPASRSWEIVTKVTRNSTAYGYFISFTDSASGRYGIEMHYGDNGGIGVGMSSNGSSWDIGLSTAAGVLNNGESRWVKVVFDGNKYTLYISADGVTYTEENSVVDSKLVRSCIYCKLGYYSNTSFNGAIDLKETCIKINDKIVWDYNNTKYYMGCLRSMMDVPNERTYNVDIVDGEAVLTTGNNQGLWGGQITIPAHDVVISYFPPVAPIV